MHIYTALALLSLIALAILGDYLWRRWIKRISAARENQSPPYGKNG